jgi:hypothetical protein
MRICNSHADKKIEGEGLGQCEKLQTNRWFPPINTKLQQQRIQFSVLISGFLSHIRDRRR